MWSVGFVAEFQRLKLLQSLHGSNSEMSEIEDDKG